MSHESPSNSWLDDVAQSLEQIMNDAINNSKTCAKDIISEREKTHGRFRDNARVGQMIRHAIRTGPMWDNMSNVQRECLDHMAGKIGRIVSGNHDFLDHWVDLRNYPELVIRDLGGNEQEN